MPGEGILPLVLFVFFFFCSGEGCNSAGMQYLYVRTLSWSSNRDNNNDNNNNNIWGKISQERKYVFRLICCRSTIHFLRVILSRRTEHCVCSKAGRKFNLIVVQNNQQKTLSDVLWVKYIHIYKYIHENNWLWRMQKALQKPVNEQHDQSQCPQDCVPIFVLLCASTKSNLLQLTGLVLPSFPRCHNGHHGAGPLPVRSPWLAQPSWLCLCGTGIPKHYQDLALPVRGLPHIQFLWHPYASMDSFMQLSSYFATVSHADPLKRGNLWLLLAVGKDYICELRASL